MFNKNPAGTAKQNKLSPPFFESVTMKTRWSQICASSQANIISNREVLNSVGMNSQVQSCADIQGPQSHNQNNEKADRCEALKLNLAKRTDSFQRTGFQWLLTLQPEPWVWSWFMRFLKMTGGWISQQNMGFNIQSHYFCLSLLKILS